MFKKFSLLTATLIMISSCSAPVVEEVEVIEEPVVEVNRNIFDGSPLEEETIKYKAFAVVINNSTVARPQYGLSKADVVYEVIKEEYLETRFMAYFEGEIPEKVGPLRSLRVPFVRIYNEWHVALVHYGGSGSIAQDGSKNPDSVNALDMLPNIFIPYRFDAVAGVNDEYFFRTTDKPAPHNAFIKLEEAFTDIENIDMWPKKHFDFDEENFSTSSETANTVTIDYPTENANKVSYEFNKSTGQYDRFINDVAHIDALYDEQISATNIIVQYAVHTEVHGYVLVEFLYSGQADYFINGTHISGYWIKDWEDDTTHFLTDDDQELVILPGNTWIQVVPDTFDIAYE